MKPDLVEYLIRECASEVLNQLFEGDEADGMDDQDQELHADHVHDEDEKSKKKKGFGARLDKLSPDDKKKYAPGITSDEESGEKVKYKKGKLSVKGKETELDEVGVEEDDETKGAAAPPADGLGSGDQPAIPQNKDTSGEEPSEPETPETPEDRPHTETPVSTNLKGIVLVNPRNKSELRKVPLSLNKGEDGLERDLHRLGSTIAGPAVKTALATTRAVRNTIKNPAATTYLYIGRYDPNSDELFLMADNNLSVAKDASVEPSEIGNGGNTTAVSDFDAHQAEPDAMANRMQAAGQTAKTGELDQDLDEVLTKTVGKIVKEILRKKSFK